MTGGRFVVLCPKDGSELIAWGVDEDGKPFLYWAETWRDESVGYVGATEEHGSRGAAIGLSFAVVPPDPGDVQHMRYVVECRECRAHPERGPGYATVIREESVKEYVFPILDALSSVDSHGGGTFRVDVAWSEWLSGARRRG